MNQAPCKDCEDRYLACHDKCEKYLQFKNERTELRNRINAERAKYPAWKVKSHRFSYFNAH